MSRAPAGCIYSNFIKTCAGSWINMNKMESFWVREDRDHAEKWLIVARKESDEKNGFSWDVARYDSEEEARKALDTLFILREIDDRMHKI